MNKIKDKKVIILISVLLVFTLVYFISISKISHAFENTDYSRDAYNSLIETIKKCSKEYAKKNESIFSEENVAYSPLDNQTVLNSNIIKIKKDENNYLVEID